MTSSKELKVAVILPSRGLMFSKTAEELLEALRGVPHTIFFSHRLPIPDCFEKPLKQALKGSYSHIWFVEDDMMLPPFILTDMLKLKQPVVATDYPVSKLGQGALFKDKEGNVIFSGTGCLLVERWVFDRLKAPYFRTDIRWVPTNYGKFMRLTAWPHKLQGYGLHDTNFGLKLYKAGIPITEIDTVLGQRKLVKLGEAGTNDGAHQIEEWTKVKPDYLYKKLKKMTPQPIGRLVTVKTTDGREISTNKTHAKKLVEAGGAEYLPFKSISIDFNDMEV